MPILSWMVQYTKHHSFAMSLHLELVELYIIYRRLLLVLPQSWRRSDVLMLKTMAHLLTQRPVKKQLILRKSSELILFSPPYNTSYHQPHHLHHSQKVIHPQPPQKPRKHLKPNK